MLDVLKRLAELDEQNPQVYNDTPTLNQQGVREGSGVTDYSQLILTLSRLNQEKCDQNNLYY